MKRRTIGKASVAVIGQGTWNMEHDDRAGAIAAIRRGLDLGLDHVDTAELYGSGRVESLVAEAIQGRRDGVFLASKVMPGNASYAGTVAACEKSLKRLATDRLDLYMLHWPGLHPLSETIKAFEKLLADGKIRAYGVSNFDVREIDEAVRIAGPGKIACNQVLYHLGQRSIEHAIIPSCEAHGITVVAYSPFGSGDFDAKNPTLGAIAKKHGASAYQVALRYLVERASVVAIPKASSAKHVEDNAKAMGFELDDDDKKKIEAAFPRGKSRGLPTL